MALSLVPPIASSPSVSHLVEIREAGLSTLPVELIHIPSFWFLADVPSKTPFLRIAQIAAASTILESALSQQIPPASIASFPVEIESQDEFIRELVDCFYNSLKHCLPRIFKSAHTSFASWRIIFSQVIRNIWDVGRIAEVESWRKWSKILRRMLVNKTSERSKTLLL